MNGRRLRAAQIEAARSLLHETREELVRADAKASTLLASVAIVIGVVLGAMISGDWSPTTLQPCLQVLWWVGAVAWLAAVCVLAAGVYPRTKRRIVSPGSYASYFGDVANAGTSLAVTAEERLGRLLDQMTAISALVQAKYRAIRSAIWLLGGGGALLLIAAVVGLLMQAV